LKLLLCLFNEISLSLHKASLFILKPFFQITPRQIKIERESKIKKKKKEEKGEREKRDKEKRERERG